MMSKAYNSKALTYSVDDLRDGLSFPSNESVHQTSKHYGLSSTEKGVVFNKANFDWDKELVSILKENFLKLIVIKEKVYKFDIFYL